MYINYNRLSNQNVSFLPHVYESHLLDLPVHFCPHGKHAHLGLLNPRCAFLAQRPGDRCFACMRCRPLLLGHTCRCIWRTWYLPTRFENLKDRFSLQIFLHLWHSVYTISICSIVAQFLTNIQCLNLVGILTINIESSLSNFEMNENVLWCLYSEDNLWCTAFCL